MDFSKFRQSGDLSDITVVVDGAEFKLHKFPLFAKSDFFCSLARTGSTDTNIDLEGFPGGPQIFSSVADFCYNMPVDFTKNNVVYIRCAAEYLRMNGLDSLAEISEKFLHDTITSAKMSRSTAGVITLLLYCSTVEKLAEKAGIVTNCVEALVDCWLKIPTKFSPTFRMPQAETQADDLALRNLCSLPSVWFVNILTLGRDKGVKLSELAEMAVKYVSSVLERADTEDTKIRPEQGLVKPSDVHPVTTDDKDADKTNVSKNSSLIGSPVTRSTDPALKDFRREDHGKILDAVLMALPEEAYSGAFMTTEWLTKVLRVATARGCTCRRFLVKIASEMLNTLSPEDLCIISPSVLHDIVAESSGQDGVNAEKAAKLVDTYMSEMARKGVLTAETFKLLASAAPSDCRTNHDKIYDALEYILKSEKDKISSDQRQELLDIVNFGLMTEEGLKRACDSQLVPPSCVARGALSLCSRLKSELDSVKYIAQMQEEELQKYHRSKAELSPSENELTNVKNHSDSGFSESPAKISPTSADAVKAAHDVLSAARTKLATQDISNFRPVHRYAPHSSLYGYPGPVEHDISFEDEMDFKFDRTFRSLDQRTRQKPTFTSANTSNHSSLPRSYFPYSYRY
ncbi:root phototropism protein 2-like [Gigantopelta aegis]|uniref:root phototropism protein 2-like n=1 Tax=Gigantopelta aegis TaxID=1735272 RepID=UPI001B88CCD7|nr:root phototropism protein 2-like [Gigantopelta aegis]